MQRYLCLLPLAALLAACGSHASTPKPTAPIEEAAHIKVSATKTYHDSAYPLSFKYPATWTAPKKGVTDETDEGPIYAIKLKVPGNVAGCEVTVTETPYTLPKFRNGDQSKDPSGPDIFHYFHTSVSGHPGMRVLRYSGKQIDGIDTFVDVGHLGIAIRLTTGLPPFRAQDVAGYNAIVKGTKLPFA